MTQDMTIDHSLFRFVMPTLAISLSLCFAASAAAQDDFASAVTATHPVVYFRLDATSGKSVVGSATYKTSGAVVAAAPAAPTGVPTDRSLKLDGHSGYITSTQLGGIATAATIMAWVNLSDLPGKQAHIFYLAGESQNGNDLDLQFEGDNQLRFFTAGGGSLAYAPPADSLLNQWHMVVATLDTVSKARVIYWDGKQVSADHGGGASNKTAPFTIGESSVFQGRVLKGQLQDAALWNRALKPAEVTAIYAAAGKAASNASGPTPASASGATAGGGQFATNAKVEIEDSKGRLQLKRPEQIAIMFLTAIEQLENNCDMNNKRACTWDQVLAKLKYDPRTDPNYTYTFFASGTAWEAHATAKKPGLMGFSFMSRNSPGTTIATFNASGTAGFVDSALMSRSIDGDSFAIF